MAQNVFSYRDAVIDECNRFSCSFTKISADDIKRVVDAEYATGRYWPDPLIQINPNYQASATIDKLCDEGVLSLYTETDIEALAADFEPATIPPVVFEDAHRAKLRAELDAYFARLYGLSRRDLEYILDPKAVMGDDYPSETFRVLRDAELSTYGEYRTQRLVLEVWDKMN